MHRFKGCTFQMKATVSAKFLMGQSMLKEQGNWSRVREGARRWGGGGATRGEVQEFAGHGEAPDNKVIFSSCILQITLFILSFDIFIKHFLGARHYKM